MRCVGEEGRGGGNWWWSCVLTVVFSCCVLCCTSPSQVAWPFFFFKKTMTNQKEIAAGQHIAILFAFGTSIDGWLAQYL